MAAAILAAFASQGAMAQSAPDTTMKEIVVTGTAEKDYAPGLATVGGKEPAALRDVPQTVNVVNRAVLEAQAANSMTEALRNVPGMTILAGEGGAIGDNINLRGFSPRFYGYLDDHFKQSVNMATASLRHKFSPTLTLGDPLATLVGPREDRDRDFNDKSLFSQTDLIAKINAGGMLHTLTTGLELGRHPHHHARRRRARARPGTGRGRTHHAGLASAGRLHAARR